MTDVLQPEAARPTAPAEREAGPGDGEASARERKEARPRGKDDERAERDRQRDEDSRKRALQTSEKDLLGLVRMAISLVSMGIGFNRALAVLSEIETTRRVDPGRVLETLSLCMVALGLFSLVLASYRHWRLMRSIKRGEALPEPGLSISLIVSVGLITIFCIALITVVINRDTLKQASTAMSFGLQVVMAVV